jgi:hypothetical protein
MSGTLGGILKPKGTLMRGKRGNYAERKRRNGGADRYGTYNAGRLITPETIAGKAITKQLPSMLVKAGNNVRNV